MCPCSKSSAMRITRNINSISYLLVLMLTILAIHGCSHHEIDTWEKWCEKMSGVDLEKKYNKWGFFAVSYNANAIRNDFTKKFNDIVVSDIGIKYLAGAKPDSKVIQELSRLRMIGVWSEGYTLHIANSLLIKDDKLGINEFNEFVTKFKYYLDIKSIRDRLDDFQYCLFGTINSFFDTVVLHGPDENDRIEIKVDHSFKK